MTLTPLLDTRSVDEARAQVAVSYCPHRLRPVGDGAGFRARHADAGSDQVRVFALGYGAPAVTVDPVPFVDFTLVSRVVSGHLTVRSGGREHHVASGGSIALDPRTDHHLEFGPGCRIVTVKLGRPLLDRVASALGGDRASRAVGVRTGPPTAPDRWRSVGDFVLTQALPQGLLAADAPTRRYVEELTAAAVLADFAAPGDDREPRDDQAALRRAVDHIQDRAGHDVGLLDIAAAAGTGPRALQRLFQRELGVSPLRYLREVRLHRARTDLLGDDAVSIAEVAHRWGFGNLGRFAGDYRRQFGVTPGVDRRSARDASRPPSRPG